MRSFRLAEPVLTDVFGEGAYCLGGGTALAAVWQHRHSTDVDLFMDGSAYRAVVTDTARRDALAAGLRSAVEPDMLDITPGVLKMFADTGELGLYVPPSPLAWMPPVDQVAGTSVPLERPATILARKLHGRMLEVGDLMLRDLYDLAAAADMAPGGVGHRPAVAHRGRAVDTVRQPCAAPARLGDFAARRESPAERDRPRTLG